LALKRLKDGVFLGGLDDPNSFEQALCCGLNIVEFTK